MNSYKKYYIILLGFVLVFSFFFLNSKLHFLPSKVYYAKDFSLKNITSSVDADKDGVEDYKDIVLSARKYIETKPKYKSKYYIGGYPKDHYGTCTDVIWNAFKGAGYSLKDLVDEDILLNQNRYPHIKKIDPNIDFRRVNNLNIFFQNHAKVLTNDKKKIKEWQPGDIVTSKNHIAIVSDKRNKKGIPYIIHHDGWGAREANDLSSMKVIGHYRWIRK